MLVHGEGSLDIQNYQQVWKKVKYEMMARPFKMLQNKEKLENMLL